MSTIQTYSAYICGKYHTITPKPLVLSIDPEQPLPDGIFTLKHNKNSQLTDILDLSAENYVDTNQNSDRSLRDVLSEEELDWLLTSTREMAYLDMESWAPGSGVQAWIADEQVIWDNDSMTRWNFHPGAENFKEHEIMKWVDEEYTKIKVYENERTSSVFREPYAVDEYGYSYSPPAEFRARPNFDVPDPNAAFKLGSCEIEILENGVWTRYFSDGDISADQKVPTNTTLDTKDSVGLTGLTLDERKYFLNGVQQLLDDNNMYLDARELRYGGGSGQPFWVSQKGETQYDVMELIAERRDLLDLLIKSDRVTTGKDANTAMAHEYSIKVTDNSGNKLPADQITIESGDGNKQIQMTVEEFKQLDRTAITRMLLN